MRRLLCALALATPLMLVSAPAALGVKPTFQTFHAEGRNLDVLDCNWFDVLLSFTDDVVVTNYFDKSGSFTRSAIKSKFSGTLTNSVTGTSAYETGHWTLFAKADGTSRVTGLVLLIRVPGSGVVLIEVGAVTLGDKGGASVSGRPVITQGQNLICRALS
jgi:hypothetical protein